MQNTDTETIGDTVERKRSDLVEHYTDWMPDNHTMPELKAQKSFQERGYQNSLVDELCQLFQHAEYAYLEAATGTGKTLIIALLAERLRLEHVTYVVHSIDILNQAQQDILDYVDAGLISQEIEWRFLTWQAYARKMRWVFTDDDSKPDPFVVVDECHMGGVLDVQSVKKSFSVIVNKAKKILWVSATPWELDEKLMGARQGHTAYYGYKEAYDEGILNKTELVRVDCGLDITLTRNQENLSARELLKHEKDTLEIEGASADATFEQLNLEVRRALGRGLRTTDVPLLVQHRYQLMAQLYVAMHRDEKAIFWLPTKQHARMCAEYINRQMESETAAIAVTGDVRYDDDSQHKLADWRNPWSRPSRWCNFGCGRGPSSGGFGGDV
jgi:superfamily II DNA or RNA helicase